MGVRCCRNSAWRTRVSRRGGMLTYSKQQAGGPSALLLGHCGYEALLQASSAYATGGFCVYGLTGLSLRLRRLASAPCALGALSVIAVACAQPTPTPEPTATPELPLPTPTPTATATPTPTATPTLTPLPTATPTPTLTPTPSPNPNPETIPDTYAYATPYLVWARYLARRRGHCTGHLRGCWRLRPVRMGSPQSARRFRFGCPLRRQHDQACGRRYSPH